MSVHKNKKFIKMTLLLILFAGRNLTSSLTEYIYIYFFYFQYSSNRSNFRIFKERVTRNDFLCNKVFY